ncbi:MAG: DUF5689 domain-containing protein [Lentimicrobiaceae bacterium]|nr:DUF5689 domain-containing protein [Lentimicrobiaceae bacterium]
MNKLRLLLVLFLGIFIFFGCKEWPEPEFDIPEWKESTALNRFYTIGTNKAFSQFSILDRHTPGIGNPPDSIVERQWQNLPRYLRAVVVSSDEGGNYYKSLVVQDSTGGIELQLDMTGLFNFYPVGQKVVIVLNDLVVGDYNDLPQMGWIYNVTQVGRINSLYIEKYIIRDGKPSLNNVPKPITNDKIDLSAVNKLVRIEGVNFKENAIGQPFAYNHITTDWVAYFLSNGRKDSVTVRTSNFAKFRSMIIEDKEYNLTGILTVYRGSKQLMIRTREDIEVIDSRPIESVVFDFTSNPIGEGKWSIYPSTQGKTEWRHRASSRWMAHFGNKAFDPPTAMDDWFISPVITYSDLENGYLRFEHELGVLFPNYDAYQIWYTTSTSSVFDKDDWKLLASGEEIGGSASLSLSKPFPVKKINANSFRIAFRYNAPSTDVETYDWYIRSVEIRNK